jgi:hypothetical protein
MNCFEHLHRLCVGLQHRTARTSSKNCASLSWAPIRTVGKLVVLAIVARVAMRTRCSADALRRCTTTSEGRASADSNNHAASSLLLAVQVGTDAMRR